MKTVLTQQIILFRNHVKPIKATMIRRVPVQSPYWEDAYDFLTDEGYFYDPESKTFINPNNIMVSAEIKQELTDEHKRVIMELE